MKRDRRYPGACSHDMFCEPSIKELDQSLKSCLSDRSEAWLTVSVLFLSKLKHFILFSEPTNQSIAERITHLESSLHFFSALIKTLLLSSLTFLD